MFARFTLSAFVLTVAAVCLAPTVRAQEPKADAKKLEAQLEKTLDAYNKDDVKAFYAEWSKLSAALSTPEIYAALYKLGAKDTVGAYLPKTLKFRQEGSVLEGESILAYYDAEFAKEKQGQLTVNYMFEDGAYKFIQITISKK